MNSLTYFPATSYWHLRDPRLKLLVVIGGTTLALTERRLGGQLLFLTLNVSLYRSAYLPWERGWQTLQTFRWLLLITFLLNLWTGPLVVALVYLFRLGNLLLLSSWLLGVTETLTFIAGLELLLHPFRRVLPVGEIAMVLGLALSFFPLLRQEASEIMLAQRARGVNFEAKWAKKIKGLLAMVIPLFIAALRRALAIAQAMEVRGYVPGAPRGALYTPQWQKQDTFAAVCTVLLMLGWWGEKFLH
jgi:energy-coupling factor transport system permease protein